MFPSVHENLISMLLDSYFYILSIGGKMFHRPFPHLIIAKRKRGGKEESILIHLNAF